MNEVRLTDFSSNLLSVISDMTSDKIRFKRTLLSNGQSDPELDELLEFNTQVIYAFSIVKERETVTNN